MTDDRPATHGDRLTVPSPLHDVEDVARLLGVSVSTIRRLVKAGELRAMRIGKQLRFDGRDIEAYLTTARLF